MTTAPAKKKNQDTALLEDDVGQYLRDIRQYPLLSPEEEKEVALRCAQGDEDAMRHMVNSNLRLVVSIARDYGNCGVPLLDLIQEGSIGLLEAAKRFDPSLGFRFSTYATSWIQRGVLTCLSEHSSVIRVPSYTSAKMRKIGACQAALQQELGRMPSLEELSERCGMKPEKVRQLLQLTPETCSLDAPVGEDASLAVLLEDVQMPQPEERIVHEELRRTLGIMLSTLSERQQEVLRLHYGLDGNEAWALDDISAKFGVSKERIRQIERQAMVRLRKKSISLGLEDFLNE